MQRSPSLTAAEFQVLVALADGDKHGYAIGKEISERTDGQVQLGAATLYTVIKRLLANGFIDEEAERPDPELDDERPRMRRGDSKPPQSRRAPSCDCERHEP